MSFSLELFDSFRRISTIQSESRDKKYFKKFLAPDAENLVDNAMQSFFDRKFENFFYWYNEIDKLKISENNDYTSKVFALVLSQHIVENVWRFKDADHIVNSDLFSESLSAVSKYLDYQTCPIILIPDSMREYFFQKVRFESVSEAMNANEDDHTRLIFYGIAKSFSERSEHLVQSALCSLAVHLAMLSHSNFLSYYLKTKCFSLSTEIVSLIEPNYIDYPAVLREFNKLDMALPKFQNRFTIETLRITFTTTIKGSCDTTNASCEIRIKEIAEVQSELDRCLAGLVGLDFLISDFAHDLFDFAERKESRARIFWGESGVGKTEFAQRISGLKGNNAVQLPGLDFLYLSSVDGRIQMRDQIDALNNPSVVFIDEADKGFDATCEMVSNAECIRNAQAILNYFSSKPVFWIFLGSFEKRREGSNLSQGIVDDVFGKSLAARIEFLDWKFPNWTLNNLLLAARAFVKESGIDYDDDCLAFLGEFCVQNGGIRTFDNINQFFLRKIRKQNDCETSSVNLKMVKEYFDRKGIKYATF